MRLVSKYVIGLLALSLDVITAAPQTAPSSSTSKRQSGSTSAGPTVDLGYAQYQGTTNAQYGLNVFKGIRYAAAPIGKLRWQAPQKPEPANGTIQADKQPPLCPQSGGAKLPPSYGFTSAPGDEDCLFLNVYAPSQAQGLPVVLWIHGGGYGNFGAIYDPSAFIASNNGGFIAVVIQYRLGAFGFLSSADVKSNGVLNAGLLDQRFALQWVQDNIAKFGGDPTKVTVGGESAGAASAILQSMAYGGIQQTPLFQNVLASSIYIAKQFNYDDTVPTQYYRAFATAAGCASPSGKSNSSHASVFSCLVNANSSVLQNASGTVSESGPYGTWAFLPVTDGVFLREAPSQALAAKAISGKRLLVGNNADDGAPLTPPTVLTAKDFLDYVNLTFPGLTSTDKTRLLSLYDFDNSGTDPSAPLFSTLGNTGPTAINQSAFATGQKQRAYNLDNEASYSCPGYWAADAFASAGLPVWKYQYSLAPSYHGADLTAIFSIGAKNPPPSFATAFQKVWGQFIINNDPTAVNVTSPSPAILQASGVRAGGNVTSTTTGSQSVLDWVKYQPATSTSSTSSMMNFNTSGGAVSWTTVTPDYSYDARSGAGVANWFTVADAETWEGGRGERCRFWQGVAPRIPQ